MSSSDEDCSSSSAAAHHCSACVKPDPPETDVEVHGSLEGFAAEIGSFYNNSELSDITLVVGDQRFYAHKFMLCKSSDVFKIMLTSSNWGESQQGEVKLEESDDCAKWFSEFLTFLYRGSTTFSVQSVMPLLFLADKYNVKDLRRICSEYMTNKVDKRNIKGAMRWLSYARKFDLKGLSEKCLEVILSQLDSVVMTEEWLALDVDFMSEILQSSDVVVEDEFALFILVQKWLLVPDRRDELEENTKQLMKWIRFSQIDPHKLYAIEETDLAKRFPELVKPLIAEAYRFHALVQTMRNEFKGEEHLPRCYSSPHFCHQQRSVVLASACRRPDRNNILWEIRFVPTDAFSGPSKSRGSHWTGVCQVTGSGLLLRVFPSEDHVEKKYKVYVLTNARDGSNLGVYRSTGVVQRGPRQQLWHTGEYMGHEALRHMRVPLHARAAMMMAQCDEDWDGSQFFSPRPILQSEPPPRHEQYPYGGIKSLRNDHRAVTLPSTQAVAIEIGNIDPQTQFTISIGAFLIS